MKEVESKEYSWKWVTDDELLSHGACELLFAFLVSDGTGTCGADLYDGENTTGTRIVRFRLAASATRAFSPKVPVYCRRGLYVGALVYARGIFIQWRELGHGEGG